METEQQEQPELAATYMYLVCQTLAGEVLVITDPTYLGLETLREASRTDVISSARYVYDNLLNAAVEPPNPADAIRSKLKARKSDE